MKSKVLRFAQILLVCAIFAGLFQPFQVKCETTDTFSTCKAENSLKKETFSMEPGDTAQLQFKITEPLKFIGFSISGSTKGRKALLSLYTWNKNLRISIAQEPLCTREAEGWKSTEALGIDFTEVMGKSLEPGEYVLEMKLLEGEPVSLTRYMPALKGIASYQNELPVYGSFKGTAIAANPVEELFHFVSENEDFPLHTAEPESVIGSDSPIVIMNIDPSTWTAVDGLGRTLPDYSDVGGKKDKKVGIFYWTWHYNFSSNKPVSVQSVLDEYPEALNDYNHKIWTSNKVGAYFWNEPLWGFYDEMDSYVLRKHAELLADAGVDFVLFDCTNGSYTWEPAYMNLLKVWSEARADGIKTPQIGFMLNFGLEENTLDAVEQVYKKIYQKGLYQDLWFYWEGKPLIMAYNHWLDEDVILQAELKNFFTWRAGIASYFDDDKSDDYWGWLHKYPQALYKNADGTVEMTTVGVAQNADYEKLTCSAMNGPHNAGRSFSWNRDYSYSYTYRGNTITCKTGMENSKLYGINFQEQWDFAIAQDPEIIFVTGWNEWIAGRNKEWGGVPNGFPDQCNDENSRDCEPSKGELKDYYYYQLAANIRRFKGVSVYQGQPSSKTIDIRGDASQWNDPNIVVYNHYTHNTYKRDDDGWGTYHYTNDGIRNDIKTARVSYDKDNLYFYVETLEDITPSTDENWMRLLLDTQAATADSKDWEEFEYILNRVSPESDGLVLEKSTGGWNWKQVGKVDYSLSGKILQVVIPRSMVGLDSVSKLEFNFKWCDYNLSDGDIMTLYTDGDAAPGGRFCFHFTTEVTKTGGNANATVVIIAAAAVLLIAVAVFLIVRKKTKK